MMETEKITHVRIKWSTYKKMKYRFHAFRGEKAVHYFDRLAEFLKIKHKEECFKKAEKNERIRMEAEDQKEEKEE